MDPVVLASVNPAPSERERVFSSTKKLITPGKEPLPRRHEASERLKSWWDHGPIQQRDCAPEDPDLEDCELQDDENDDCEL
jgi:hypothetical protein